MSETADRGRYEGLLLVVGLIVAMSGISLGARGISTGLGTVDPLVLGVGAVDVGAGLFALRRSLAATFDQAFGASLVAVVAASAVLFVLTIGL
jgi:hypothetical protein